MLKQRKKLSILIAIVFVLSLATPLASAQGVSASQAASAAELVLQMGGAASVQYALIEGDEITLSAHAGVYSLTESAELTADNLYGIGSVSKTYTATAVMTLVEDGLVNLDTPVVSYIPEFTMADERFAQITVRMLLNHSSGLWGSSHNGGFLFEDTDTSAKDELLERLSTQTLKADPGAYSVYCNDGFTLAEILVERVSGKDFTSYLREAVLEPAGLESTYTPQDEFDTGLISKAYYPANTTALPQETLGIIGTGGIYASAEDLASFGSVFYTDSVLSQASIDAMSAPEYLNGMWHGEEENSISYGLGFDNVELYPFNSSGIQVLVKGGDTLNYHASLMILPEYGMAAAVVSSGGASIYNQLLAARILIDALAARGVTVDENVYPLPEAEPADIPESELEKAGVYGMMGGTIQIDITDEGMTMMGMQLKYYNDGSYRDDDGAMMFKLVEEDNGRVYLYQKAYMQIPGFPPLVTSDYAAELLTANETADSYWDAWEQINGLYFFMLNEGYTSQLYLYQPFTTVPVERDELGYIYGLKIADSAHAVPVVQTPGAGSRDYQSLTVIRSQTGTYLMANDYLMLGGNDISTVYSGTNARCTIQADGYARWYSVGGSSGKQMTVASPETSNFYIYDASGIVVASSIFGDTGCTLPEGGYMVFLGDAGDQFLITIG